MGKGPSDFWGSVMIGAAVGVVVLGAWAGYQLWTRKD
jgi:hypothetical protein